MQTLCFIYNKKLTNLLLSKSEDSQIPFDLLLSKGDSGTHKERL